MYSSNQFGDDAAAELNPDKEHTRAELNPDKEHTRAQAPKIREIMRGLCYSISILLLESNSRNRNKQRGHAIDVKLKSVGR
jgi:hypothetical protein